MRKVVAKKTTNAIATILIILVANFVLFRLMPGDPAVIFFRTSQGARPDPGLVEQQRQIFGIGEPMQVQVYKYIVNTFSGQWGYSFFKNELVGDIILQKAGWTLLLVGISTVITLWIGIGIGAISAWRRGKTFDLTSLGFGFFFYAMPTFWLGLVLIILFGQGRGVLFPFFPAAGSVTGPPFGPTPEDPVAFSWDIAVHLFLPSLTLALVQLAGISIIMRNSLIDVLTEDYIVTARAKGLSDRMVLKNHAMPNARLPMVTVIALNLAFVLGGALQVEVVFSYDGLGKLTVDAISDRDFPLIQGLFLLITFSVVVANLVSDFVYAYLDPRVRLE